MLLPVPTPAKPWPEGEEHASLECIMSIRCTKSAWLNLDPSLAECGNFLNSEYVFNKAEFTSNNNFQSNNFLNNFGSAASALTMMTTVVSSSSVAAVPVLPLLVLLQGTAVNAYPAGAGAGVDFVDGWVGPVALAAVLLTGLALLTAVCIARKHAAVGPTGQLPGCPPLSPPLSPPPGPPSPLSMRPEGPLSSAGTEGFTTMLGSETMAGGDNVPCAYGAPVSMAQAEGLGWTVAADQAAAQPAPETRPLGPPRQQLPLWESVGPRANATGFVGVKLIKKTGRFEASVESERTGANERARTHLGTFGTALEAAAAYAQHQAERGKVPCERTPDPCLPDDEDCSGINELGSADWAAAEFGADGASTDTVATSTQGPREPPASVSSNGILLYLSTRSNTGYRGVTKLKRLNRYIYQVKVSSRAGGILPACHTAIGAAEQYALAVGSHPRPEGRPPNNSAWDPQTGDWVCLISAKRSKPVRRTPRAQLAETLAKTPDEMLPQPVENEAPAARGPVCPVAVLAAPNTDAAVTAMPVAAAQALLSPPPSPPSPGRRPSSRPRHRVAVVDVAAPVVARVAAARRLAASLPSSLASSHAARTPSSSPAVPPGSRHAATASSAPSPPSSSPSPSPRRRFRGAPVAPSRPPAASAVPASPAPPSHPPPSRPPPPPARRPDTHLPPSPHHVPPRPRQPPSPSISAAKAAAVRSGGTHIWGGFVCFRGRFKYQMVRSCAGFPS